jgi:hypothetical protein
MILKGAAIVLSLLLVFPVVAELDIHTIETKARTVNNAPRRPFLVDLKKNKSIEVAADEKLLPNRLYKRYDTDAKGWVFDVTGANGKFQFSEERGGVALGLNSTIPGEWAGGSSRHWYKFTGPSVDKQGWVQQDNPGEPGMFYLEHTRESTRQLYEREKVFHSQREEDK